MGDVCRIVNYADPMKIDPEDLIDAGEVAELLGLARRQAVSTYRSRYADFPAPVIEKNSGKCALWLRRDVERWAGGLLVAGAVAFARPAGQRRPDHRAAAAQPHRRTA